MNELPLNDAIEILMSEKEKADAKLGKAYDSYCLFPNEKDQIDWDTYDALSTALDMAIKALGQPRKGEWLRMSDLSEKEDDRYQCSQCNNVVHYKNKMNLYTFNSWCGRCGSDNGRKMEMEL